MAQFALQRKDEASLASNAAKSDGGVEEMIETAVKRVNRRAIVELSGEHFGCTWNSAVLSCFYYHRDLTGLKQQPFFRGRKNQEDESRSRTMVNCDWEEMLSKAKLSAEKKGKGGPLGIELTSSQPFVWLSAAPFYRPHKARLHPQVTSLSAGEDATLMGSGSLAFSGVSIPQ
ncbi:hypothetical protein D4764_06G0012260 [Takifugu flavidus]|uniref:Uncharacterized protein n=1 Tax=Takifugu flavidus TaxID=433684 RepID=A0A5C6MX75_9TELE|nr:hypothetical protein D4764_06G0012260 [Takifugu flavidus]